MICIKQEIITKNIHIWIYKKYQKTIIMCSLYHKKKKTFLGAHCRMLDM